RRLAVAMWFHFRPLGVRQHKSFHLQLESQTSPRRNPEPQQPLGQQKSTALRDLEKYVVFQNKFVVLSGLCADLHADIIDTPPRQRMPTSSSAYGENRDAFQDTMNQISARADRLYGNCLQLRLLTPIMAEAFINMVVLMFCKDAIRDDSIQYQAFIRAKIPQRLELLTKNCHGFVRHIDMATNAYRDFMRVIDKRNFALHGNVDPLREQIETIYFDGKRPLFNEPGINVEKQFDHMEALYEPDDVIREYEAVHEFLVEIRDCLDDRTRAFFDQVITDAYPGYEVRKKRVTRILPDHHITGFMQGMRYDDELNVTD
ncbi:hypothetical protein, partial [Rhizobium leguminosarum]|uniref:hypothetical protein n=1 Tax=Rhizobium leguminosarum TaxID=384 RepID=UPI0019805C50